MNQKLKDTWNEANRITEIVTWSAYAGLAVAAVWVWVLN